MKKETINVKIETTRMGDTAQAMRAYIAAVVADKKLGNAKQVEANCKELNKLVNEFVFLATAR